MNEQVINFLKENQNSDKAAIIAGTGIKGLPLYNFLKRAVATGQLISAGDESNPTYSLNENYKEDQAVENHSGTAETEGPKETVVDEGKKEHTPQPPAETKTTKATTNRDNSKYTFEGEEYGKGPLVLKIVRTYCEQHPDTTHKQLLEVFPTTLMKRFGVFANESEAKKLSGNKPRYFMKPEQMIKIKGQKEPIAICNQWTAILIEPFIKVARELGYKIK